MNFTTESAIVLFSIAQCIVPYNNDEILRSAHQIKETPAKNYQCNMIALAYIVAFMECKRSQPNDVIKFIKKNIGLFYFAYNLFLY